MNVIESVIIAVVEGLTDLQNFFRFLQPVT